MTAPIPDPRPAPSGRVADSRIAPAVTIGIGAAVVLVYWTAIWYGWAVLDTTDHRLTIGFGALASAAFLGALAYSAVLAKRRQNALRQLESANRHIRLAAKVFDASAEAIVITDPENKIVQVNPAFTATTGWSEAEVLGKDPRVLSSGRHTKAFYADLWYSVTTRGVWQGEIWNRRKSGEVYPEWLSINALRDSNGKISNFVALFYDITERKMSEEKLKRLAHYDPLTSLPNRLMLRDRLGVALKGAKRDGSHSAVLFLDLDHFKFINDSLGHAAGDRVLVAVADRLRQGLRGSDTLSRQGGDEFALLLPSIATPAVAAQVAERLLAKLEAPFLIDGHRFDIGASIGIAIYPQDGENVDEILRHADAAMYRAKDSGRSRAEFFTPDLSERATQRLVLQSALRHGLANGEFIPLYQPQYRLEDDLPKLIGFEALARWQHPERGLVPPSEFIPIAEETGLIVQLGRQMMEKVACDIVRWIGDGLTPVPVAVNVSAKQFQQRAFVDEIGDLLKRHQIDPRLIEIEITESIFLQDPEETERQIHDIKALGVSIAIDDFGTGYSSLGYLKTLPIDRLKIDRRFVTDSVKTDKDAAIVSAIMSLASALRMQALAEGVETHDERNFLQSVGCHHVQGFLFGRPVAHNVATALLAQPAAAAASGSSAA